MYMKLNHSDVLLKENVLTNYKLCYIDSIPETVLMDDEETILFKQTEEWKKIVKQYNEKKEKALRETGRFSIDFSDPFFTRQKMKEYPNPEYIPGQSTHFAYFTPKELKDQNGEDWGVVPYDCNAGKPYDDNEDIIILTFDIEFGTPYNWAQSANCVYSVRDINNGAVAWIYDKDSGISIHAGTNPYEFLEKIKKIKEGKE